jgi:hypothetical protein
MRRAARRNARVNLAGPDIDGINAPGAACRQHLGKAAGLTDDLFKLTGQKQISMHDFAVSTRHLMPRSVTDVFEATLVCSKNPSCCSRGGAEFAGLGLLLAGDRARLKCASAFSGSER